MRRFLLWLSLKIRPIEKPQVKTVYLTRDLACFDHNPPVTLRQQSKGIWYCPKCLHDRQFYRDTRPNVVASMAYFQRNPGKYWESYRYAHSILEHEESIEETMRVKKIDKN